MDHSQNTYYFCDNLNRVSNIHAKFEKLSKRNKKLYIQAFQIIDAIK